EHAVAGDHVVDELDRPLLPDRERRHRLREDDGLLQRQHRQRRGDLDVLVVERHVRREVAQRFSFPSAIVTRPVRGRWASGSTTVSRPRSYVASAADGSTSSARAMRRWNGPYSISIWRYETRVVSGGRRRTPAISTVRSVTSTETSSGSIPG